MKTTQARVAEANRIIKLIGLVGRRFFFHNGEYSDLSIDRADKLWLTDARTRNRIDIDRKGEWLGFSDPEQARTVVEHLRDYVLHGALVPFEAIGRQWGYPDSDVATLRQNLSALHAIAPADPDVMADTD